MLPSVLLALAATVLACGPARAADPALLFHADFDRASAAPSSRSGESPSCLTRPLDAEGVGGRGLALLLRPGEGCSFPAGGNLDPRGGTLSFWVVPRNWSDGEGRNQTFFSWSGVAGGRPFNFYVDSPPEPGAVRLVVAWGGGYDPRQQIFQIRAPVSWEAGRWEKIDVTWDEREIVIYANGEAGERVPLETVALPALASARLQLTPPARGGTAAPDATALDELEIWDAALPADRIRKRYRAAIAPPLAAARLRVPRAAEPPRLDGSIDDAAWARATRIPLLADGETGGPGLLVPHVSFVWGVDAVYVAWEAPLTDAADAFELTLTRASGVPPLRARVTPEGLAGGRRESPQIGAAARAASEAWSAELRLPLAAPGGSVRPGERLQLDVRHVPAAAGALASGAHEVDARIELADESEGVRIAGSPDLALGRIALDLEPRARTRAELRLVHGDRVAWEEHVDLSRRRELRAEADAGEGVLRTTVRDEEGREWLALESRIAPLEVPGVRLVPEPSTRRLGVELDLRWLDGRWSRAFATGAASLRLEDRGPGGAASIPVSLRNGQGRASLASGLAPGSHTLALELSRPGERLVLARRVEVPPLPWLGGGTDVAEEVLEPWLPLAWDDDASVRVWNRRYRFDGPLLAAAEAGGRAILREAMRLRVRTDTGEAVLRTTSEQTTARSGARAERQGTADWPGSGIEARWSTWVEYDGLVVTSLTLEAPKQRRIDALELEIPIDARLARYLRGGTHHAQIRTGRLAWNGRRFATSFEPFLWLSDEAEGFLYFAESDANWVGGERDGAIEVRGGPDAGITLRLIRGPVSLPGPVTYQLGFQVTPVKPLARDARAWNFGWSGPTTPHERAIAYFDSFAVADGLWDVPRPEVVRSRDRALASERGVRPFYYAATSATPDFDLVFHLFDRLWRSAWSASFPARAQPASPIREAVPAHVVAGVCPGDASLQDRMLYDGAALLRSVGAIGLYTDTDGVHADDNPLHGCGFADAFGRRGVTWTILKKRRFAKRLAALVRTVGGGRRYWMSHAHARLVPPVHGFADFWLPGEELGQRLQGAPYFYVDELEEEAWRVEYGSASSGVVHVFLPELWRGSGGREDIERRAPTQGLLAEAAVHDVNVSSVYANREAVGEFWGLRERLGLIEAEFVGYWRADCPLRVPGGKARASLYRTPNGPVLAVANLAAEPSTVEVQLDLAALAGGRRLEARDERRERRLGLSGDQLAVPLAGRDYTFVTLRAR